MATGADPVIPRGIREKFHLKPNAKLFNSDQVLKLSGFQNLAQAVRAHDGKCKVAILGGSHSAFSVIHLLLFGPCQIKVFESYRRRQLTIAQHQLATQHAQGPSASGKKYKRAQ